MYRHPRQLHSLRCSVEVAGLGFEPRLPVPETGVLPLDDPAVVNEQREFY